MASESEEAILQELSAIKRLLVFALLREGATQAQVAAALNISRSQVSKMFPGGISTELGDAKGR